MDHCVICGQPITTEDCLVAIETHAPPGQKGCSVEIRWVSRETARILKQAYAFASADCAQQYLGRWIAAHMHEARTA